MPNPKSQIPSILIATHNAGKLAEFRNLLQPYVQQITSAGELGLPVPDETGSTFIDNARLKAHAAAMASKIPVLADDSGLCVAALKGEPGLDSALWGGPQRDFNLAMQKVQKAIGDNPDRSAYFICVLVLVFPDGREEIFEGRVDGTIIWPPRGNLGHGYDPIFQPLGEMRTFGEMLPVEKDAVSHRGKALQKLLAQILNAKC